MSAAPPANNPNSNISTAASAALDRFVVLSLLEDLHHAPIPDPSAWQDSCDRAQGTPTSPEREHEPEGMLLTAGSSTDEHEESVSHRRARLRAIRSLSALGGRLGPRWSATEVIPYLVRCVQEDDAELTRVVASVVPSLINPSISAGSTSSTLNDIRSLFPLLEALCVCHDDVTRVMTSVYTVPSLFFGTSLLDHCRWIETRSVVSSTDVLMDAQKEVDTASSGGRHGAEALRCFSGPEWSAVAETLPCCDAFERTLKVANALSDMDQFVKQCHSVPGGGFSQCVTLLHEFLDVLAASPWVFAKLCAMRIVAVLVSSLLEGNASSSSNSSSSSRFRYQSTPATQEELSCTLAWASRRHILAAFHAAAKEQGVAVDVEFERLVKRVVTSDVVGTLKTPTFAPFRRVAHVGAMMVDSLHPAAAAEAIRILPHLMDSSDARMLPTARLTSEHLLTLRDTIKIMEHCLLQQHVRVEALRMKDEVQQFVQRHDDSKAGSSFVMFHALCDTLQSILLVHVFRVEDDGTVDKASWLQSQDVRAALDAHARQLLDITRLLFIRGANYSSWKHRFFVVRRGGALLESMVTAITTILGGNRGSPLTARRGGSGVTSVHEDVLLFFQQDLLHVVYPQLCGDGELEVRCVVAHHMSDAVIHAATLLCCTFDDMEWIADKLAQVAAGFLSAAQVCAMDASDRVRASAAASVADVLLLFDEGCKGHVDGYSWVEVARAEASVKIVDAAVAILLDLFRDDHDLVHLSVIEQFGDLLGRQHHGQEHNNSNMHVARQKMQEELLKLCHSLQTSPIWRVRQAYVYRLTKLLGSVLRHQSYALQQQRRGGSGPQPLLTSSALLASLSSFLQDTIIPQVLHVLFDSVKAVRDAALEATVGILESSFSTPSSSTGPVANTHSNEERSWFVNEVLWPKILAYPKAQSTYLFRAALMHLAIGLRVDVELYLLPLVDTLSHDPVANVRLVVAAALGKLLSSRRGGAGGGLTFSLSQKEQWLLPVLRGLVEDLSVDVREAASVALQACV